jgi:predicted alpha/beta-hydrolase family hydrolase
LVDGERGPTFLFAHGAGAPMNTPWMNTVARGLADQGIRVVRFEFPYMRAKKKVPDREPVLRQAWHELIAELGSDVFIGGKSMGGRIATMVADELNVRGVVCFGYPFHPPGQPRKLRTAHLENIRTPVLIIQGTRDTFGNRDDVAGYTLSKKIRIEWIEGGDHSFKPKKPEVAVDPAARFINSQ